MVSEKEKESEKDGKARELFLLKREMVSRGKGEFLFKMNHFGLVEASVFIGLNTNLEELETEIYPKLFLECMEAFPEKRGAPMIALYDGELDDDERELWDVLSTRKRYLGAILALCRFVGKLNQPEERGIRLFSPETLSAGCSCLLGKSVSIALQMVDDVEVYREIERFLERGLDCEMLECVVSDQGWSEKVH